MAFSPFFLVNRFIILENLCTWLRTVRDTIGCTTPARAYAPWVECSLCRHGTDSPVRTCRIRHVLATFKLRREGACDGAGQTEMAKAHVFGNYSSVLCLFDSVDLNDWCESVRKTTFV